MRAASCASQLDRTAQWLDLFTALARLCRPCTIVAKSHTVCCRYTFQKSEGVGKRSRANSAASDSPDVKRNRNSTDSDALLKSVASLEQSNQVSTS